MPRIKPSCFYIVIKFLASHPYNNLKKDKFEVWKEYDESHIYDSPIYEIMDYFDTRKEALTYCKHCKLNYELTIQN